MLALLNRIGHRTQTFTLFIMMGMLMVASEAWARPVKSPNVSFFSDETGRQGTYNFSNSTGDFDFNNPFFQSLGSNGRTCASCHQPDQGWSITPLKIQKLFSNSKGLDPLFDSVDGTNNPALSPTTLSERQAASSLLLNKGLIRIPMPITTGADFELVDVSDPNNNDMTNALSLFRRPLPTGNVAVGTEIMWDGRESPTGRSLHDNLISQAANATIGHGEGTRPSASELESIVAFQLATAGAQFSDLNAERLDSQGASGGPLPLAATMANFFVGINDPFGGNFNPEMFHLFNPWASLSTDPTAPDAAANLARISIARGQAIFETRSFVVSNMPGLNGPFDASQEPISATCSTCHNNPGVGNHSVPLQINLGFGLDADLPVFTLRRKGSSADCTLNPLPLDCSRVSDPGQALVSGKFADIGKFKVPQLRNLAARPPYFHNGRAAQTEAVVGFYNFRFRMGLTAQERTDLANFLRAL